MNLITKRLRKRICKIATLTGFDTEVTAEGYFIDYCTADECDGNIETLENYLETLSDEQKNSIIVFNDEKKISNEDDLLEIAEDILDAIPEAQLPDALKPVVSNLNTFQYVVLDDTQNCACAFLKTEMQAIMKLDQDEDDICSEMAYATDGAKNKPVAEKFIEYYLKKTYPEACKALYNIDPVVENILANIALANVE